MFTIEINNMNLNELHNSGQCFRWKQCGDNEFLIPSGDKVLRISQSGNVFTADCSEAEWAEKWHEYFDMDTDYEAIGALIEASDDAYLKEAYNAGRGVRILRQDLWEMIVSFIVSQNNNIKRIRKSVEAICVKNGRILNPSDNIIGNSLFASNSNKTGNDYPASNSSKTGNDYLDGGDTGVIYAFPNPEEIRSDFWDDTTLGLGYRDSYLRGIYEWGVANPEELNALPEMTYEKAYETLMSHVGIGPKVANCICLFGLHHVDAFPIDTHVKQILAAHYPDGFPFERYEGVAGIIQQYMFYHKQFLSK